MFSRYGRVDSVRVFPAKAYAFVNFADAGAAVRAMAELDGVAVPVLTGVKPVVMRFQQDSGGGGSGGSAGSAKLPGVPRVHSESHLSLAALHQMVPRSGFGMLGGSGDSSSEDGVGVVPTGGRVGAGGWAPDAALLSRQAPQAGGMQRSMSMGLLGNPAFGVGAAPFHSPVRDAPSAQLASLLAMQRGRPLPAAGQAPPPGALPPLGPRMQASSSANHLSAVLNNLAALQRAASTGLPVAAAPGPAPGVGVQPNLMQLNLMQQAAAAQGGHGLDVSAAAAHDIARLSARLAGQSLTTLPDPGAGALPGGLGGAGWGGPDAPASLVCPLSGQVMVDPVVAADGVTYSRQAIAEWMSQK